MANAGCHMAVITDERRTRPKKTQSDQHLRCQKREPTRMRIAQIAPLTESVPPRTYGGTERVVSYLTEELMAMGHDVTLFASGDRQRQRNWTRWPARCGSTGFARCHGAADADDRKVYQTAHEFDVLHCHLDYWPFSLLSRQPTPYLTTLHGRLDLPELHPDLRMFDDVPLVSISDAQRRPLPRGNFVGTVHHGLPPDLLTPTRAARLPGVPRPHLPGEIAPIAPSGSPGPPA